jgi:hypothetical protein
VLIRKASGLGRNCNRIRSIAAFDQPTAENLAGTWPSYRYSKTALADDPEGNTASRLPIRATSGHPSGYFASDNTYRRTG